MPSLQTLLKKYDIEVIYSDSSNENRICCEPGCEKLGQHMGKKRADGTIIRRKRCEKHHREHQAAKKGLTPTQWTNSFHPYLKYRKEYCENTDGRLGYKCTTTIVWDGQLDTDHINSDPTDNRPENLQTLCKCCHAYKTNLYKDYATPGRKALKELDKFN